tara:strand:- start:349 stop:627 length:279 start_codon:yes stop_codon:yes gene_type:complete
MIINKFFRYIYYRCLSFRGLFIRLKINKAKSTKDKFTLIYNSKYWSDPLSDRSVSGYGSDSEATKNIIPALDLFIKKYNIKSILDIPCGDFK